MGGRPVLCASAYVLLLQLRHSAGLQPDACCPVLSCASLTSLNTLQPLPAGNTNPPGAQAHIQSVISYLKVAAPFWNRWVGPAKVSPQIACNTDAGPAGQPSAWQPPATPTAG